MDIKNLNTDAGNKYPVLKVGFVVYIIMILTIIIMVKEGSILGAIILPIVGYIGAIIGNAIRLYAMPDAYFTDGTLWGNIKSKLFWSHGPQVIGYFVIFVAITYIFAAITS